MKTTTCVLVADDVDYYRRSREVFIKVPEQPMVYNTPVKYGCPYDCGLCPDHEQHSCLTRLIPFDTFNMFYRGGLETTRLPALRKMGEEFPSS